MSIFGKGKSAIEKLQEEKQKIENRMAVNKLKQQSNQSKPFRMTDESASDYQKKLQNARRTGRY
jgi:hypothetical protein